MIDCFLKFFVGISHFELRILRKVGRRKYIYMRIALSVSEQEKSRLVQIREEEFSGGIPGEFRGKGSILFSSSMILINFSSREWTVDNSYREQPEKYDKIVGLVL